MPILTIYGMPLKNQPSQAALTDLVNDLQTTVSSVLNIDPRAVSVFFPVDHLTVGLGEELICKVEGLFESSERTAELRTQLADDIASILATFANRHISQCRLTEAIIARFDQITDGFGSRSL